MKGANRFPGTPWIASLILVSGACVAPGDGMPGGGAPAELDLTLDNIHRTSAGVRGVAISPDGRNLAISGPGPDGSGLYLAERADGGGFGLPGFWLRGSNPAWAPAGDRIAFAAGGEIRVADVGDVEARPVMDAMEGVRAPAFSPDGRTIAFYSTESGHQDIWLVSTDGSGPPRQLTDAAMALDDPRFAPAWSPDGGELVYVSNASDYWHDDLWIVEVETGDHRQLTRTLMAMSTPVWSPEGDRIAVFGTAKGEYWYEDLSYIYVVGDLDGAAGPSERIVDMQVHATDAAMRHAPSWSADGEFIYFPYLERGTVNVWAVPAAGGVATRVTHMEGTISGVSHTAGAGSLAFVHASPVRGGEAYALDLIGGVPQRLTSFAPVWRSVEPPEEIAYSSFDGLRIQGFLYRPPQLAEGASCPALVQVHGGGTNSYQQGLNLTEQYLASKGFLVLAINYRGGSGFGREFQDLSVEDWLWDQARDAGAAADFLRTLPYVNGKVGIYGGSYGGSMSLSAVSLTPDRFDAAVPMRGAYSKLNTLEYTDRLGKIFSVTGHGGTPEERPDTYAKSNVVSRIADITAPVLLMHGELDRRVPIQNFEHAVAEFERLGKSVEVKTYPDEAHGFRNPDNRVDTYSRLEEFFTRHLGGCAAD
ncbi:prolyl oligopeptidase family serine peptidase [Candidatus Palauibacter sp.]|uniref:S9 family peptidase n=1 Tax=Candidatus Palauibacter sp. TaxID=3101350 RepID=UPI003B020ACC